MVPCERSGKFGKQKPYHPFKSSRPHFSSIWFIRAAKLTSPGAHNHGVSRFQVLASCRFQRLVYF